MNENIISWNFPNWITIALMAALSYMLLAFLSQLVHAGSGNSASTPAVGAVASY